MPPNSASRTIWTNDNLDIMRCINSKSVDLVYLDPPFNSNRNSAVPVDSQAAASKDISPLDDVDLAWHSKIADQHTSTPSPISICTYVNIAIHATIPLLISPRSPKSRRNPIPRLPATRRPFGRYWLHVSACRTHAKPRRVPDPFQRRPSDQPTASSPPSWHDAPPLRYASATQLITNFNKRREGRDRLRTNAGHPLQLFHRIEGPLGDNRRGFARADAGECP